MSSIFLYSLYPYCFCLCPLICSLTCPISCLVYVLNSSCKLECETQSMRREDHYQAGGRSLSLSGLHSGAADTRISLRPSGRWSQRGWRGAQPLEGLPEPSPPIGFCIRCEQWTKRIQVPASRWFHSGAESRCGRWGWRSWRLKWNAHTWAHGKAHSLVAGC